MGSGFSSSGLTGPGDLPVHHRENFAAQQFNGLCHLLNLISLLVKDHKTHKRGEWGLLFVRPGKGSIVDSPQVV